MFLKSAQKIWAITGTSTGLGRHLAMAALARGDKVIATARSCDAVLDVQRAYPERCNVMQLDVADTSATLAAKARQAVGVWGSVDVLVNNAGHGLFGTVEEAGVDGMREMYKTNLFGAVNVTNAFLPHMRERRSGTIVFIGSRSGWRTNFPLNALYGSSKAALHAVADTLAEELRPLSIRVLNIVPGALRTCSRDSSRIVPDTCTVSAYSATRSAIREYLNANNGTEKGDPARAASAIVDVVRGEGRARGRAWPGTLVMGGDAMRDVRERCEGMLRGLDEWEDMARSVEF